jgi:hypothetical protein
MRPYSKLAYCPRTISRRDVIECAVVQVREGKTPSSAFVAYHANCRKQP